MRARIFAVGVVAATTISITPAHAQSSVTVFGILDVTVRNIKNDEAIWSLNQDGLASSRLGFRGVEDLGGGLQAGFWIEGGISADTGTAGGNVSSVAGAANAVTGTWNRRSTVSLMGGWGEIRLGRDFVPDFWNHGLFDPFGTTGVGSSVNAFGTFNGATTLVRANNSVAYFLPPMGGFYGQAMVAAGEGVPNQGNKHKAARIGYKAGPVDVAASIGHTDGAIGGWKRFNVVGSYSLGSVRLLGQYASSKGSGGPDDGAKQVLWLLGITSTVGLHEFKASYLKSDSSGTIRFGVPAPTSIETRDATQLALGYVYRMSKRTALLATYSRLDNDAGARYVVGSGGSALTAGKTSSGFEVGILHSF